MKHGVPSTPIKKDKLEQVTESLIGYQELAKAALIKLQREKRGNPQLWFKLQVEIQFAVQILRGMFKVDLAYFQEVVDRAHRDPEWDEEVKKFANGLVPEKPLLITTEDFARELGQLKNLRGRRG